MPDAYHDAVSLCKTIMRNGFEAYVISPNLVELTGVKLPLDEADIATDMDFENLRRLFPGIEAGNEAGMPGLLSEGGHVFRFYSVDVPEAAHPERTIMRVSPRQAQALSQAGHSEVAASCRLAPGATDLYEGFADFAQGTVRFSGIPDETLKRNYLLGYRALRFSANYSLPLEANTRMAIVRGAQRMLDYVAISDVMDEWRKVEAEAMYQFLKLLFDVQLLHGLIPEVAALSRVSQIRNEDGQEEDVFSHTLEVMRRYPEELPYDWFGTLACMLHDVGKLFTAEFYDGKWHFHQHHRIGAKIARKILGRLRMLPEEIDLITHLVRHHMRFAVMLTDRGIRRFKALDEYPRLIELQRADIKARDGNYTFFNHNMKYLERAETPEEMLEPLLNGREIMDFTGLKPGPVVGIIRDALLQAQVAGEVGSVPEAVDFVRDYARREVGE